MLSLKRATFIAVFVALAAPSVARATDVKGVYLTPEDYTQARLSSESDCGPDEHKVELHDWLHKSFIHVTHNGVVRRYEKDEIFGFRTCNGRDYRFVGNLEYEILEAQRLVLYSFEINARRRTVRRYFFSDGAGGMVTPLTRINLKRAFPDNHRFHDALDQTFRRDADLKQYDEFHGMFKVNRLLTASLVDDR
jgi:hypothetical protein